MVGSVFASYISAFLHIQCGRIKVFGSPDVICNPATRIKALEFDYVSGRNKNRGNLEYLRFLGGGFCNLVYLISQAGGAYLIYRSPERLSLPASRGQEPCIYMKP
jgi:hypothetical protein